MTEQNKPVSIDDLTGNGSADLFKRIDQEYRAASAAMANGDMAAWVEHARPGSRSLRRGGPP